MIEGADTGPVLPDFDTEPQTLLQTSVELRRTAREVADYFDAIQLEAFFAPLAHGAWSPADHVRHLTKSMRAVTNGLTRPRVLLALLFGWTSRPSRSFFQLRSVYRAALGMGRGAGRFAPKPMDGALYTAAHRRQLMAWLAAAVEEMDTATARWTESAIDRYQLPHPLLGKLTVREMLFFTLFHNVHHVHAVERRRRTR